MLDKRSSTPARKEGLAEARVLAVDLDDLTLGRLKSAVRETELSLVAVSCEEALEQVRTAEMPTIVLIEWADGEETAAFCRALQSCARPGRAHIIALGGPSSQPALFQAMEGAVNDVLSRPFGEVLLVGRLRQGLRAMHGAGASTAPRDALREALASSRGGEIAVRSGDVTAVIHVQNGHIVWANVSSAPATMEEVMRHGGVDLDREIIDAVKEECRATGANFADVLVQWGVLDEDRAREAVRAFVADRVERIFGLPDAAALFLPRARPHSERLRFRASEIPSLQTLDIPSPSAPVYGAGNPPSSRRTPELPLADIADRVRRAMCLDGAIAAAVLDRKTGACLHHQGEDLDTEVAWSQLGALAALGSAAADVLASTGDRCFLTRPLGGAPTLVLFVVLSLADTTLGMARAGLAHVADETS